MQFPVNGVELEVVGFPGPELSIDSNGNIHAESSVEYDVTRLDAKGLTQEVGEIHFDGQRLVIANAVDAGAEALLKDLIPLLEAEARRLFGER